MKKQIYFLIAGLLLLVLAGCSKFLTHDNPTEITDDKWWTVEANATSALEVLYDGVDNGLSGTGKQLAYLSALTDENTVRTDSRGDYEIGSKGQQQSDWGVAEVYWTLNYEKIRQANRFLEHIDGTYISDATLKERYKAEARAIRAYLHMELLMLYGGVPIVTTALTPSESAVPRNTEQEVYDFVVSELEAVAGALPGSDPSNVYSNADNYRISYGACWALISRLALYYKHYDISVSAARKVIATGVFKLYRSSTVADSYADLFKYDGELNDERILFSRAGATDAWESLAPYGVGGITTLSPTASIVDAYETLQGKTLAELGADSQALYRASPNYMNNRDPRLQASILLPGDSYLTYLLQPFSTSAGNQDRLGGQFTTATGYWQQKYLDSRDRNGTHSLDFMVIRYAEVLLNYAEAQTELGNTGDAAIVSYLNDIRERAGMPDVDQSVYNTAEKLRGLVRRERQVELAFEGLRLFDIRRWGILADVMAGLVYGAVDPSTAQSTPVETRTVNNARDYYWPIPRTEMIANPNMKQNPLY